LKVHEIIFAGKRITAGAAVGVGATTLTRLVKLILDSFGATNASEMRIF